jgi:hypothetical protein
MGDRWRTASGWSVEVVHLTATPDRHDGEWIRVAYFGWHVADVRDVADLERWFPLGDLEPDSLTAGRRVVARPVPGRRAARRPARHGQVTGPALLRLARRVALAR